MCFICHVCIDRYVEKYALSERFRTVLLCRILKPGERFRMVLLSSKLKNGSERFRTIPELLPILGRIERNGSERFPVFFPKKSKNGSERFQMSRIQYATFEEFFSKTCHIRSDKKGHLDYEYTKVSWQKHKKIEELSNCTRHYFSCFFLLVA